MKLELEGTAGGNRINGYDRQGIRINGRLYSGTLLLMPEVLLPDFPVASLESLDVAAIEAVIGLAPELLLLGTGARQRFPPAHLLAPLRVRGIGVEVMSTAAACRLYTVLAAEGRRAAALLMPPDLD